MARTAFPTKFDEGGSAGFISKDDERRIADREAAQATAQQPYQRTFWDRALNRRVAPEGYQNTGASTQAQTAWGNAADRYMASQAATPGWKKLDDQTRTEAYDPLKDRLDPRNTGYVDPHGRVNPSYDPSRVQYPPRLPSKPATKLSSSQAITNKINKIVGPPQVPPPVLPQDFVPGINLRPQSSADYDVPPDARPPGSGTVSDDEAGFRPGPLPVDPTLYPQVWGLPSFNQADYPPAGPAVTAGHPALPTLQRYLDWRNRKMDELAKWGDRIGNRIGSWNGKVFADGGPVGYAEGGHSHYEAPPSRNFRGSHYEAPPEIMRMPSMRALDYEPIVRPSAPYDAVPTGRLPYMRPVQGFARGGRRSGASAYEQESDLGDDDFMPSISLGMLRGPSQAVLAPFLAAPALPQTAAPGGGGSGGAGDMIGGLGKILGGVMGGGKGVSPSGPLGSGAGGAYTTGDLNPSGGLGGLPGGGLFGGGGGGFPDIDSEILDWSSMARGGRAGFAQGGGTDDDFMPSISLGQMHAPSTAVLAPMVAPPALPSSGGGGGGKGGGGGGLGGLFGMLGGGGGGGGGMGLPFMAHGGRLPLMRGGYPDSFNMPPLQRPGLPQRHAFAGRGYVPSDGRGDGRSDHIDAALSPGEFVMDAETTSMLGDGNNEAGARKLEGLRRNIRQHKGRALAKGKFSPKAKAPEQYMSAGLTASDRLAHSGMGDGMRQLGRG